ncbi:hypothetical protein D9M70_636230 [compost metagenome]
MRSAIGTSLPPGQCRRSRSTWSVLSFFRLSSTEARKSRCAYLSTQTLVVRKMSERDTPELWMASPTSASLP